MDPFFIYFLVLTGIYLAYYTVIITLDLHGKKGGKKDSAEIIPVDSGVDDRIVSVRELSGGGYEYTSGKDADEDSAGGTSPDVTGGDDFSSSVHDAGDVGLDAGDDGSHDDSESDELYGVESPEEDYTLYNMLCDVKDNAEEMNAIMPEVEEELRSDDYFLIINQPRRLQTKIFNEVLDASI